MVLPVLLLALLATVRYLLTPALELKLLDLPAELAPILINSCYWARSVDPLIFLQLHDQHVRAGWYLNVTNDLLWVDLLSWRLQRIWGDSGIPRIRCSGLLFLFLPQFLGVIDGREVGCEVDSSGGVIWVNTVSVVGVALGELNKPIG